MDGGNSCGSPIQIRQVPSQHTWPLFVSVPIYLVSLSISYAFSLVRMPMDLTLDPWNLA
jgi:hypothetical protein